MSQFLEKKSELRECCNCEKSQNRETQTRNCKKIHKKTNNNKKRNSERKKSLNCEIESCYYLFFLFSGGNKLPYKTVLKLKIIFEQKNIYISSCKM